jgi:DNA repair protein RadD
VELRPYQSALIERVRQAFREGANAPLMVLPTGGGKTVCFVFISRSAAERGKRILILAHRIELIDQICGALRQFDVAPDIIASGYPRATSHICVASVQTLGRRLKGDLPQFDLIVCDEAHHVATSKNSKDGNTWGKVLARWPEAKRLGVTATPLRLDGRGLGFFFDRLLEGPSVAELTALGHLAPCRVFAPPAEAVSKVGIRGGEFIGEEAERIVNTRVITGSALDHYRRYGDGQRALAFTISISHAADIAAEFRAAGYEAVYLSGMTATSMRRAVVADFQAGNIQVLASCDLFSEGFDCPGAQVGIMLRPTMSLSLHCQQVGRILRPFPGKTHALLLDHVGNTERHGLPDQDREWTLSEDRLKKKAMGSKTCPQCYAALPQSMSVCPECGHIFSVSEEREIEQVEGDLREITRASVIEQLKLPGFESKWGNRNERG